jgi:hypothetical protein
MRGRKGLAAMVVTVALAAGCGPAIAPAASGLTDRDPVMSERRAGMATVVTGAQIRSGGSTLLEGLRTRIANLRVERSDRCPEVRLRGQRSVAGNSNPAVYVNGTRAANTCVLEQIQPVDIEAVEVYANGVSNRPGYRNSPTGLVLVFTRNGR